MSSKNDFKMIVNAANFMWIMLTWLALYFRFLCPKKLCHKFTHSQIGCVSFIVTHKIVTYSDEPKKKDRECGWLGWNMCSSWKQAFKKIVHFDLKYIVHRFVLFDKNELFAISLNLSYVWVLFFVWLRLFFSFPCLFFSLRKNETTSTDVY